MDREIEVHIDWDGATRPVGRLWARAKGARQTCSFAYDAAWLGLPGAFPLDPNLPLVRGDAHWDGGLFNAFSDPAPDRWGRSLMGRRELPFGDALWIDPCNSIHTFFMRIPIDVLLLDRDLRVVKAFHALVPWRMTLIYRKARTVLELPAGTLAASQTAEGDQLDFQAA